MRRYLFHLVDEVLDCGDTLEVRNNGLRLRIPLADCRKASYVSFPPCVTIALRNSTVLGTEIAFAPKREWFSPSRSMQNTVRDLNCRIEAARRVREEFHIAPVGCPFPELKCRDLSLFCPAGYACEQLDCRNGEGQVLIDGNEWGFYYKYSNALTVVLHEGNLSYIKALKERLRGDCPFCYGMTVNFHARISEQSPLDAFLVFGPPWLDQQSRSVELDGFTCHIAGMWPMYASEIEIYNEIGLERFWHHDGWDPMNVNRPPITGADG